MAVAKDKAQPAAARQSSPDRAAPAAPLTKEQELAGYRDMLLIRRFEEKAG